jgi:hypothetical protein
LTSFVGCGASSSELFRFMLCKIIFYISNKKNKAIFLNSQEISSKEISSEEIF